MTISEKLTKRKQKVASRQSQLRQKGFVEKMVQEGHMVKLMKTLLLGKTKAQKEQALWAG